MTDDRMREALEEALRHIEYIEDKFSAETGSGEAVKARLREALSPPVRRTSYEWEFPGDSTKYSVRWGSEDQWSVWAMNWRTHGEFEECGFGEFAFAIATLAGLEKEEAS